MKIFSLPLYHFTFLFHIIVNNLNIPIQIAKTLHLTTPLRHMKRKQKQQHNPQKQVHRDLQYLEKKLGEQKENLVRENKKLQKQIHEEIEENRLLKLASQKSQQILNQKLQALQIQNQSLRTQLLLNQSQQPPNSDQQQLESKLKQTLSTYKALTCQNQLLKTKLEQFTQIIEGMQEHIKELERENVKLKKKIKDDQVDIKNLAKEIHGNKEFYRELQGESEKTVRELDRQIEENGKLEANLAVMKKKNKQFNAIIKELEERLELITKKQYEEYQSQLNELRKQKQQLEHNNMEKQRQIQFLRIAEMQKKQYEDTLTKELLETKNVSEANAKENAHLAANLQKVENENRRLQIELEREKSRFVKEMEESQTNHQEELTKIKKKTADEVSALFKAGHDNKAIQNYMDGLRSHKSQMNLRGAPTIGGKLGGQQKIHIPFEKLKYENEISTLHSQIQTLQKQFQSLTLQNQRLKKSLQQTTQESQSRHSKTKQLNLQIDRLHNEKRLQQQRQYKQLTKYRNIETEYLEHKHNMAQFQEATNLKISYYDKKIKQYIDTIDRKDSMIEGLRNGKLEGEARVRFVEEKLGRVLEEVEGLRKWKADTGRKEELVKEYKEKVEKYKTDLQGLKAEVQKLKKEKTRLERNLQSKQQYINTLKAKSQKQQQQKQHQAKQSQSIKELKQKYETKLKKHKKHLQQLQQIIQSMRSVIAQKIQEAIKRTGSLHLHEHVNHGIGGSIGGGGNWEAASLLGLKSSEIEEFVNPTVNLDRNICEDLDGLWEERRYEEFMRSSIQYILLKNQRDPIS